MFTFRAQLIRYFYRIIGQLMGLPMNNIVEVYKRFPTNEDCLIYLELIRWNGTPICPRCSKKDRFTMRNKEASRRRRWWCGHCRISSSVTVNTIMHGTRLPLQKWILAINILVNAKESVSSHQLGRELDIPVKTAYRISQKIRKAMLGRMMPFLREIVETDEICVGGRPRHKTSSKCGRGTNKMSVIGAVERDGNVVTNPMTKGKFKSHELRKSVLRQC